MTPAERQRLNDLEMEGKNLREERRRIDHRLREIEREIDKIADQERTAAEVSRQ